MDWTQYLIEVAAIVVLYYGVLLRNARFRALSKPRQFVVFAALVLALVLLIESVWPAA